MALEIKKTHDESKKTTKKSRKSSNNRVHFILDESGSMGSCRNSTIEGFNEYVNGLKNDKNGNKYKISLTKFEGGNIVNVYDDVHVNDVPILTTNDYCPCGGTNLNDAIGSTMVNMKKNAPRRKHNTLIIIMTDGHENMSQEWSAGAIAGLVKEQEKEGWTVTFLGANIDTVKVGHTYAIHESNTKSYTTANMGATMRGLSAATTVYASNAVVGSASCDFFAGTDDWTEGDESKGGDSKVQVNDTLNINIADSVSVATVTGGLDSGSSVGLTDDKVTTRSFAVINDPDLLTELEKATKRAETSSFKKEDMGDE